MGFYGGSVGEGFGEGIVERSFREKSKWVEWR